MLPTRVAVHTNSAPFGGCAAAAALLPHPDRCRWCGAGNGLAPTHNHADSATVMGTGAGAAGGRQHGVWVTRVDNCDGPWLDRAATPNEGPTHVGARPHA